MWIRLGVDISLTDEEFEKAFRGDGDVIVKALKEGFTICGDSYVPEPCSPTGKEVNLYLPEMMCKLEIEQIMNL